MCLSQLNQKKLRQPFQWLQKKKFAILNLSGPAPGCKHLLQYNCYKMYLSQAADCKVRADVSKAIVMTAYSVR